MFTAPARPSLLPGGPAVPEAGPGELLPATLTASPGWGLKVPGQSPSLGPSVHNWLSGPGPQQQLLGTVPETAPPLQFQFGKRSNMSPLERPPETGQARVNEQVAGEVAAVRCPWAHEHQAHLR